MNIIRSPTREKSGLSEQDQDTVTRFIAQISTSWSVAVKYLSCVDFDLDAAVARYQKCEAFLKLQGLQPKPEPTAVLIHYLHVPLFYLPSTVDKTGATLLVFNARYWVSDVAGTRRMLKLLTYICDKAASCESTRRNGVLLISNLQGLDKRYQAVEVHRWIMQMLEYYMPVRLRRVLVVNAPWWAQVLPSLWKPGACESGLLATEIAICNDLLQYVDSSELPRELGGTVHFKHKEWIADQMRMEEFESADMLVEVDLADPEPEPTVDDRSTTTPSNENSPVMSLRSKISSMLLRSPASTPPPEPSDGYFTPRSNSDIRLLPGAEPLEKLPPYSKLDNEKSNP
ncbi:hypothetical protein PhCBS80983_g02122 [Powellomyces hirtus]|uniref:CRAL-TRIO domain-containing protein n=1 Tax=Powellomyces hirtus TaxID=109895 RepID=A0A507E822_9FUNG|nr:hypothetical protein PhCBS80983_g02122 [Powellomyces hirtus]